MVVVGVGRVLCLVLSLVHTVVAVVAEDRELLMRHPDVVELLALRVALGAEEGTGELDVPSAGVGSLLEDLHVVDPERTVHLERESGDSIVLPFLDRGGALVEPDLGVGDDESITEELIVLIGTLHDISLS